MRIRVYLFFGLQLLAVFGHASQCRDIFIYPTQKGDQFPINNLFAGQSTVGYDYAYFKALRDAGVDAHAKWKDLKPKQRKKMEEALERELSSGVPVIIDPQGRVFSVDQHHDMFALLALTGNKKSLQIPLEILRDFSKEDITFERFKEIVRRNGWIYEKNIDDVLHNPLRIHQLTNSVERSVVGMAFAEVSLRAGIPLKGKHFSPFVQFLLADFMQSQGLIHFGKEFRRDDVERVTELILNNPSIRRFLAARLKDDIPKRLEKFLED